MVRKLFAVAVLGTGSAAALVAIGCASESDDAPHALRGDRQALQKELAERQRWTDDKGHYHPKWRDGVGTPPGFPRGRPVSD